MKLKEKWELWVDRGKMAIVGTGRVLKQPKYASIALVACLFFAYFLTMFKNGTASWNLLWSGLPLGDKMALLFEIWGRVFLNFTSLDGVLLMFLTILQGIVIALLVFVWRGRDKQASATGLEAGSVGAVLGFLAVGCPSCGISLLTPLLTALVGTGVLVMADVLGWVFLVLAFVLLALALHKMGYSAFIILMARRKKHAKN